jgi:type III pantothenate kinase
MLLCIDIGNTNLVLGVFDGEKLVENWRVGTNAQITPDEYAMIFKDLFGFAGIEFKQIHGVIISTVVPPLLPVMVEMSRKYIRIEPMVVTHELKTGITIRTDNPKEVGADRIVNAAFKLSRALIIVDFVRDHADHEEGDYLREPARVRISSSAAPRASKCR